MALSANAAYVVSLGALPEEDVVLYEKNAEANQQPAALVRLMAGALAFEMIEEQGLNLESDTGAYTMACWQDIREKYLAKDRKVEYTYSYTIRSFTTDREVLDMYAKRPDAFNEEELLRAATLMKTDAEKIEVYRTLLARFPRCETAINNLAYLYLRAGMEAEARTLLQKLPERYPDLESKQLKIREEAAR